MRPHVQLLHARAHNAIFVEERDGHARDRHLLVFGIEGHQEDGQARAERNLLDGMDVDVGWSGVEVMGRVGRDVLVE